jgi:fatty acid desaturase
MTSSQESTSIEWPTIALIIACTAVWMIATTWLASVSILAAILLLAPCITLHSSLQHEVLHGHPTRSALLNEALVFPAVSLVIPYRRFRDLHLAHHTDATLTDPYDDPESYYLTQGDWADLSPLRKRILQVNNTLLGRMTIGPALGLVALFKSDWDLIRAGDASVRNAWALHALGLVPIIWWFASVAALPFWAYMIAAYLAISILKIRTFLEHQAHAHAHGRTVVIEDRGVLAFLFLNNNFHVVHHIHPRVAWYKLPALYFNNRERYLTRNGGYVFENYRQIIANFLLRAKEPVAHPLWHRKDPL